MRIINYLVIIILLCFNSVFGQSDKAYIVKKTSEIFVIDGELNENIWQSPYTISDFWQSFPSDNVKATYPTEIKMAFDDKFLYLSAKMYSKGNDYIVTSLKRDYRAGGNDNISFGFDTFDDHSNAFLFGCNTLGVMREGLMINGAIENSNLNMSWDNKWKCATQIKDKLWQCEMQIPLTSIRYKPGSTVWNLKSYRFDTQSNETSVIERMPQNLIIMHLGFSKKIVFEEPLPKTGLNGAIIPYVSARFAKDFENPKAAINGFKAGFGTDAKLAITSGLNLDVTFNPDFSNVEADRQIVNLTRFDVSLPEQRQFFTENSDMFSGFGSFVNNPYLPPNNLGSGIGNQTYSPFFSRKIGIAFDSTLGVNVQNQIQYGLRLSGKIDNKHRIGLLNIQAAPDLDKGISTENYSVASLQRQIGDKSNISFLFINKTKTDAQETDQTRFNRVGGVEYNFLSKNNHYNSKIYYHHSISPVQKDKAYAQGFLLTYQPRQILLKWQHEFVGSGFNADAGFIPRKDYLRVNPTAAYNWFPNKPHLNRISLGANYDQYSSNLLGVTDRLVSPFVSISFQNAFRILLNVNHNYTLLSSDFDALRSNGKYKALAKGTQYNYVNVTGNVVSDQRKPLFFSLTPTIGQFFNGSINSVVGNVAYRLKKNGQLSINGSFNNINLEQGKNTVYLIGPVFDLAFTKSVFLNSVVQYNSQFNNLNVNARLQYRFAPVSDIFLVYTNNVNTSLGQSKNQAIFAKMTYWFSL